MAERTVSIGSMVNFHVYDDVEFPGPAISPIAISDIDDIVITSPADNEVLAFDNASGDWINQTAAEAGIALASHNHSASDINTGTFSIDLNTSTNVVAGGDITAGDYFKSLADLTTDTAPADDTTMKRLSLQKLAAPPTNAAYIAFANNPGSDVFYLILEEG